MFVRQPIPEHNVTGIGQDWAHVCNPGVESPNAI